MGKYAVHRTDTSAKPLIAHLKAQGIGYEPLGGVWDGVAYLGERTEQIDWKTPGKESLTPAQAKLIAKGFPLRFISTPEQVESLAARMKGQS